MLGISMCIREYADEEMTADIWRQGRCKVIP